MYHSASTDNKRYYVNVVTRGLNKVSSDSLSGNTRGSTYCHPKSAMNVKLGLANTTSITYFTRKESNLVNQHKKGTKHNTVDNLVEFNKAKLVKTL